MFPDPETGEKKNGIARVRYSHDAMIDLMVAEPSVTKNRLAELFDRTPGWISQVVNSDAFQARLADRREQLVDPVLTATIRDRLASVAAKSLELIIDKLNAPLAGQTLSDDFLLKSAKMSSEALGYGARSAPQGATTNVAVVIQVPQKIQSATEWATVHSPGI